MKKFYTIALAITALHGSAHAQPAKSVYAELGGPGLASANFDIRFTNSEKGIGGRIGVGGFGVDGAGVVIFPVGINYLLSKDNRNYFEVGAGYSPLIFTGKIFREDGTSETFTTSFGHLWMGYRLQPKEGGFLFRAGISPVFGKGFFIPYYAGISFGYKF